MENNNIYYFNVKDGIKGDSLVKMEGGFSKEGEEEKYFNAFQEIFMITINQLMGVPMENITPITEEEYELEQSLIEQNQKAV